MKKHAEIIRPKFDKTIELFEKFLGGKEIAKWLQPSGGYFISLDTLDGCAKEVVLLAKEAGVTLTGAGATYPYGQDPYDASYLLGAELVNDVGEDVRHQFRRISPNQYELTFEGYVGVHYLQLIDQRDETPLYQTSISVPYSDEYKPQEANQECRQYWFSELRFNGFRVT